MLGFCLARLQYLDVPGHFRQGSAAGEWYWYQGGHYRIGITLHLSTVIPAGILMVWQFLPIIRHKAILFHRINGYIILVLLFLGNIGALMIARRAFGGDISTQSGVGTLAIMTYIAMAMAYYNVKRLQIDQHRAWMLRMAFYMGVIITLRLIMILSALILAKIGSYHFLYTCGEILSVNDIEHVASTYPSCLANGTSTAALNATEIAVQVSFSQRPEEVGASLRISFGAAMWMAMFIHGVGVEIYLALTPREAQRLRMVSYERQLEAGFSNPGSAGLVVERFGDADPWKAPTVNYEMITENSSQENLQQ